MHRYQSREVVIRAETMSPFEIIRSATTVNAELLNRSGELGIVAPGARADLIVIDGDPLADISFARRRQRAPHPHHERRGIYRRLCDLSATSKSDAFEGTPNFSRSAYRDMIDPLDCDSLNHCHLSNLRTYVSIYIIFKSVTCVTAFRPMPPATAALLVKERSASALPTLICREQKRLYRGLSRRRDELWTRVASHARQQKLKTRVPME